MSRGTRRQRLGWPTRRVRRLFLIVSAPLAMTASLADRRSDEQPAGRRHRSGRMSGERPPPSSPANALAASGDDNEYVSTDIANADEGYGGFGIVVPAGSIINGITVRTGAFSTDNSGCQLSVRLSWRRRCEAGPATRPEPDPDRDDPVVRRRRRHVGPGLDRPNSRTRSSGSRSATSRGTGCATPSTTSVDWIDVTMAYTPHDQGTRNPPSAAWSARPVTSTSSSTCPARSGTRAASRPTSSRSRTASPASSTRSRASPARAACIRARGSTPARPRPSPAATSVRTPSRRPSTASPAHPASTPTSTGINTGSGNDAGDRPGVPNVMFVLTDGSPNKPNTHSDDLDNPDTWLQGANAAIGAADAARTRGLRRRGRLPQHPDRPGRHQPAVQRRG